MLLRKPCPLDLGLIEVIFLSGVSVRTERSGSGGTHSLTVEAEYITENDE